MSIQVLTPYWFAFKRSLPVIVLISLGGALVAYGAAVRVEPEHQVHFSYLVSLQAREQTEEYTFDGYYALQATDLFTATVAKWLTAPELIVQAYMAARLSLPSEDPIAVARTVRAEKTAPQLVEVTVRNRDREVARRLADGLQAVLTENVAAYHREGVPALTFRVVPTTPWIGSRQLGSPVIGVAIFIFIFVIATNVVLFRESIRHG